MEFILRKGKDCWPNWLIDLSVNYGLDLFIKKWKFNNHNNNVVVYGADFETLTAQSDYYKQSKETAVCFISVSMAQLRVNDDKNGFIYQEKLDSENKIINWNFLNISDYLNFFVNTKTTKNGSLRIGFNQIHYYHNGQKWDMWFLSSYLRFNCWRTDEPQWMIEKYYQFKNIYQESWLDKHKTITYYGWNNELQRHIKIEIRDSLKFFQTSIEAMGKQLQKQFKVKNLLKKPLKPEAVQNTFTVEEVKKIKRNIRNDLNKYTVQQLEKQYFIDIDNFLRLKKKALNTQIPSKQIYYMLESRCENDARILAEYLGRYLPDMLPTGTTIDHGTPSLAIHHMFQHYDKEGLFDNPEFKKKGWREKLSILWGTKSDWSDDKAYKTEMREHFDYYRGGVCSLNIHHQNKTFKKRVSKYDENSLYPSIFIRFGLPIGKGTKKTKLSKQDRKEKFIFVKWRARKVKQNEHKRCVPFLSVAWGQYSMTQDDCHYLYELNNAVTMMTLQEFEIIQANCTFEELSIDFYYVYEKSTIFNSFYQQCFDDRNEFKKQKDAKAKEFTAKLKQNSSSGKWGEKPWRKRCVEEFDQVNRIFKRTFTDNLIYDEENEEWSKYCYVPLISAVTSIGRALLMTAAFQTINTDNEAIIFYCDTDSLILFGNFPQELMDNFKPGFFKNEGWSNRFKPIRPKSYVSAKSEFSTDWEEKEIKYEGKLTKKQQRRVLAQSLGFVFYQPLNENKPEWLTSSGIPVNNFSKITYSQFHERTFSIVLDRGITREGNLFLFKTLKFLCSNRPAMTFNKLLNKPIVDDEGFIWSKEEKEQMKNELLNLNIIEYYKE